MYVSASGDYSVDLDTIMLTFNLDDDTTDSLKVNRRQLGEASEYFKEFYSLKYQHHMEDMTDFSKEAVITFVTIIDDWNVQAINEGNFRELNKMARVFKVPKLVNICDGWLIKKINTKNANDETKIFIFDESTFIAMKWNESNDHKYSKMMVEKFNKNLRGNGNTPIISHCLESISTLSEYQIDTLLKLVVKKSEKQRPRAILFCEAILADIRNRSVLDKNVKYIFIKHNFILVDCKLQNRKLFSDIFDKIIELENVSREDYQSVMRVLRNVDEHIMEDRRCMQRCMIFSMACCISVDVVEDQRRT